MCIFSSDVSSVGNTQIFARSSTGDRQFLVYSMQYEAVSDLAMILPLPTPPEPLEDAVRFIDFSIYSHFFDDLAKGFIHPVSRSKSGEDTLGPTLQVHEVGSFQASFVPTQDDFKRLDRRFRLPAQLWDQLPVYSDYAYAVFKLKSGAKSVHPMAFEFPRRDPNTLFFPTVHIHEGKVEPKAHFDHTLYFQADWVQPGWSISSDYAHHGLEARPLSARHFIDITMAQGVVDPDTAVQQRRLHGLHHNKDLILPQVDIYW